VRRLAVLGSTGSIGVNALDVARHLKSKCRVVGIAARRSWEALRDQAMEFSPTRVAIVDRDCAPRLTAALNGIQVLAGEQALCDIATADDADVVLSAITGAAGLAAGLAALRAGKTLALANKESLVSAGPLMMEAATAGKAAIVPVDSEHSAVFQAMQSGRREEVAKVYITGSGGPFRTADAAALGNATVEQALKHPTWRMGAKITVDSATLMNKALEVIEAKWLFGLEAEQIEVVIHPQSIVHSLVEFRDGSVIAQLGLPDMRVPIQYAITYPERLDGNVKRLDLTELKTLTFEKPDTTRFPSILLGFRAAREGGTMGAVLNAANEVAVEAFLARRLAFPRIVATVAEVMERHSVKRSPTLDDILQADAWARREAAAVASRNP